MGNRIIELRINEEDFDDQSGVDGIALVENPAIEEDWYWFAKEEVIIVKKDQLDKLGELMKQYGQPVEELNDEGWIIVKVEGVDVEKEKEEFSRRNFTDIVSNPNEPSALDGPDSNTGFITRTRYKYVGPQDSKNRDFCSDLMSANRVYRREDIDQMTLQMANPQFGSYNIFEYRGSYNCRHRWVKITYKMDSRILNKANSRRGVIGTEDIEQLSTETEKTANAKQRNQSFTILENIDNEPVYSTIEEALVRADHIGCSGYHEHQLDGGTVGYMACSSHKFESYNDYPESAKNNAKRALEWVDKNGWGSCGEATGKNRANQLANGENISEDTISRMASFKRHQQHKDVPYSEGCGGLMWDAWGGTSGIEWASRKLKEIREEFIEPNPCQSGYEAIGTKIKNGREVPNCVPKSKNSQKFSLDEEKRIITGPAMVPNKMIPRRGTMGEVYSVFFTEETIRKISEKFLREKHTDKTNLEHTPINLSDVYVIESWIIEDPDNDKSTKFGYDLPSGTWMVSMKVEDDKIWNSVKQGNIKGFSVEGYFVEKLIFNKEDEQVQTIINILNNTI